MGDQIFAGVRRTKIVATLGPASAELELVKQLITAGTNVFRCNFSHGDHAFHRRVMDFIRQAAGELAVPVAIMQDLQGPKLRIGELQGGGRWSWCRAGR